MLSDFWKEKKEQALARGDKDCPICFSRLAIKDVVLLDCTHMYHRQCLESFERYDIKPIAEAYRAGLDDGSGLGGSPIAKKFGHTCPMCRHPKYQKVQINL